MDRSRAWRLRAALRRAARREWREEQRIRASIEPNEMMAAILQASVAHALRCGFGVISDGRLAARLNGAE